MAEGPALTFSLGGAGEGPALLFHLGGFEVEAPEVDDTNYGPRDRLYARLMPLWGE